MKEKHQEKIGQGAPSDSDAVWEGGSLGETLFLVREKKEKGLGRKYQRLQSISIKGMSKSKERPQPQLLIGRSLYFPRMGRVTHVKSGLHSHTVTDPEGQQLTFSHLCLCSKRAGSFIFVAAKKPVCCLCFSRKLICLHIQYGNRYYLFDSLSLISANFS